MQYVGIHTQQSRNNFRSLLLLCLFPCLVVGLLVRVLLFAGLFDTYVCSYEVRSSGVKVALEIKDDKLTRLTMPEVFYMATKWRRRIFWLK